LFTTREHFHKVELLLNEHTTSLSKSVETLLELLFGRSLLRRVSSRWVLLRWVLLRWVLLRGIALLLGWVLLRGIALLLGSTSDLDLDSGLLSRLHY